MLPSFEDKINIAIIGASGAIGSAFVEAFTAYEKADKIYTFSRSNIDNKHSKIISHTINIENESSIALAAECVQEKLDIIVVATGFLHDGETLQPEKSLREIDENKMIKSYMVNTIGPALIGKHFIPLLQRDRKSVFAAISARVSSISDNQLGGWYSYRCAKSALNMFIKTASIEAARKFKQAAIIGLHPGTVDSKLSEPFKKNVAEGSLFSPAFSVDELIKVIDIIKAEQTGQLFAWDGQEIPY